jgi:hypothetical protein
MSSVEPFLLSSSSPQKNDEGWVLPTPQFFLFWFFFFFVLGLELRAYTLSHSTSPFL